MRYYVIGAERGDKTMRLGATSAAEALKAAASLRRDGWTVSSIERGTETITLDDLRFDAGLNRARAH